jgi:hypothetical protein
MTGRLFLEVALMRFSGRRRVLYKIEVRVLGYPASPSSWMGGWSYISWRTAPLPNLPYRH